MDATLQAILTRLDAIARGQRRIISLLYATGAIMSKELDDLTTQVAKNNDVEQSALVLIQGLAAQLAAAGTDPAKLAALRQSLDTSATALAAAVAANTP